MACAVGVEPSSCKRSVLADSYCCPKPAPSLDVRVQALCAGLVSCSSFPSAECQSILEKDRVACAARFEPLLRCAAGGDACTSGQRCAAAFTAYYVCQAALSGCTAAADAVAPLRSDPRKDPALDRVLVP